MDRRYEVIIVGGGPVGAGLAIELGRRGVRCALVERRESPQLIPKGQNLTQRTMEHFAAWGVEGAVRARRLFPDDFPIGGVTAFGSLLSGYSYPWYRRDVVGQFYFTANERLPQYETELALRERIATLGSVDTWFGWSAEAVEQDDGGVRVAVTDGSDRRTLEGDYVVGCDGSRSLVRGQAGITETLSGHDRTMVLLVFRSPELHEALGEFRDKSFFNVLHPDLEGYWRFLGRVDPDKQWFFHSPVPDGTTQDNYDFAGLVNGAVGAPFTCEFDYIGFWDLRIATADAYRRDRAFVAGDAAHSHPPYGAYGINTGFEDARNLGWKLAATLRGWGSEALLDSYGAERLPVFQSTARDFIEAFIERDRVFVDRWSPDTDPAGFEEAWEERRTGAAAEVHSFEPHYEGSPLVHGPAGAVSGARGTHMFTARAGHHLAPRPMTSGDNVFHRLGDGFTLLAFDALAEQVAAFTDASEALGIPLTVVGDTYAGDRADYEARLILVRPDAYVAWAGDEPADAAAILARAAGRA